MNAYQSDQGGWDAFVTKLDTTKSGAASLIYSTYLGGGVGDAGRGIAVDSSGCAYVTGDTWGSAFPIKNEYQAHQGSDDAFVTKIDTTKSGAASLIYSTYLGGASGEAGRGIAVDSSGCAYVTGDTWGSAFPIKSEYQADQGGLDAFVTKIDTTKSGAASLIYSTYLGGASGDTGSGIAVDSSGCAYVTGRTDSSDFPTQNAYQGDLGETDAFVTKLSAGGSSLQYSTYLGGDDDDSGVGIAVDSKGCAYVTGETLSTDFPTQNAYQEDLGGLLGFPDAFVTKLSAGGSSLEYSTYLGGGDYDIGHGIAVDSSGCAYVTGQTLSEDFPTEEAYQGGLLGFADAFVTKLCYEEPQPTAVGGEFYPINKLAITLPWIVLAMLLIGRISWLTLRRHRAQS